jgi:signal peptidase
MTATHLEIPAGTARSGARHLTPAALVRGLRRILILVVLGFALLPWLTVLAGYRPMVVQSGSMAPAVNTGDAIVSQVVHPSAVSVGDVVTFVDTLRDERLVTHRVVEVRQEAGQYSFVTKGDRNSGVERWDMAESGTLGRLSLRVPKLGFVVAAGSSPGWRALFGAAALVMLTVTVLRRIWS